MQVKRNELNSIKMLKRYSPPERNTEPRFVSFCNLTTLHGWNHLTSEQGATRKAVWSLAILASILASCYFAFLNIDEFMNSGTITSINSMTAPLSDITFPAITLCNVNPVSLAFLRTLNITTLEQKKAFIKQFVRGSPMKWRDVSEDDDFNFSSASSSLTSPKELMTKLYGWQPNNGKDNVPIARLASQNCSDMIIYGDYKAKSSFVYFYDSYLTATDYGICCWMHPKLDLEWQERSLPQKKPADYVADDFLGIPPGVRSGIKNGFKLIVDVEGEQLTIKRHLSSSFK